MLKANVIVQRKLRHLTLYYLVIPIMHRTTDLDTAGSSEQGSVTTSIN